ncbi:MAG: hypothetical protein II914_05875 [Clostridia bacterium]|nr:hypothetical protein [Clostridia bacterium]
MRVLVIPDVHLKPKMFIRACGLMQNGVADRAVCLMDIADDWWQEFNLGLYERAYDAAIEFAKRFPDTLWCYGNHDVCYLWDRRETGYSARAAGTVRRKLAELRRALPNYGQLAYLHRIGNCLFSHAGLADRFVRRHVCADAVEDTERVIMTVNGLEADPMWELDSPIWYRPQYDGGSGLYKKDKIIQVVGHTPVPELKAENGLMSCDVFSTDRNGNPVGTQEFLLLDTDTAEYCGIR